MLWLFHKGAAMTNKDLLNKAMTLKSLSETEWDLINEYLPKINDNKIAGIINKLCTNQARLEITRNYLDYYFDFMEEPVRKESLVLE